MIGDNKTIDVICDINQLNRAITLEWHKQKADMLGITYNEFRTTAFASIRQQLNSGISLKNISIGSILLDEEFAKLLNEEEKEKEKRIKKVELEGEKEYDIEIHLLRDKVIEYLVDDKRHKATEEISKYFEEHNKLYSIRDDNNPEMWIYKEGIYVPEGMCYIRSFCRLVFGIAHTTALSNAVIEKIKADTYIDKEEFFKVNYIYEIPILNGLLNLKTKELNPFTQDKIFFNKLQVKYNKEIKIEKINQFLKDILSEEDITIIQELFGFCLVRKYFIAKAFTFLGGGANGKSRLLELLKRLIGAESCSNISPDGLQKNEFALSELFNKMINIAGDISTQMLENTDRFKQLTGGDLVGANRKFLSLIYFVNYAKIIFSCNELPKVKDLSDGFWRRIILIRFNNKFITQKEYDLLDEINKKKNKIADENILDKITTEEEMSGLLNFALDGLSRLLEKQSFSYSKTTEEVRQEWLRNCNSFEAFFVDRLENYYGSEMTKEDLRQGYFDYCETHKIKPETDKSIFYVLRNKGVWDKERKIRNVDGKVLESEHIWVGIKFKIIKEIEENVEEDEIV